MHLVVRPSTTNLWLCKTMLSEQVHTFEEHDVTVIMFQGEPYFRAVDVTRALGYTDSAQALRKNAQNINVKTLKSLKTKINRGIYIYFSLVTKFFKIMRKLFMTTLNSRSSIIS